MLSIFEPTYTDSTQMEWNCLPAFAEKCHINVILYCAYIPFDAVQVNTQHS